VPFVDALVCWLANCLLLGRAGFQGAITQICTDRLLLGELAAGAAALAATSLCLSHRLIGYAAVVAVLAGGYALTRLGLELKWMLRARRLAREGANPVAGAA
jgi:hypothetical protein